MDAALNDAMDRYATGDDAAFATVYELLAPRLFAFLFARTRDRALAEDLAQQTFLRMHLARESYVTGADVTPWAIAIAQRLAVDTFRKRRREVVDAVAGTRLPAKCDDPEDSLCAKRAAASIAGVLLDLPPAQRSAFVLLKLEGRTLAEAAATLGKSVLAVKLSAHRAYVAIRQAAAPRSGTAGATTTS